MRTPFVGIGTGRCGTNSLAEIVNSCKLTHVTHEAYQMYWYEMNDRVGAFLRDARAMAKNGILCGEVSQASGSHIGELRCSFRDLKVVCLHRDKESTVDSFMNFGSNMLRPGDKKKWVDGCIGDTIRARAQKCFPIIDAWNQRQAYEFYWEMYEKLMESVCEPVMHMDVNELSGDLDPLFDFLEIPESDRAYPEKRKFFTSEDVDEKRKEIKRCGAAKPR